MGHRLSSVFFFISLSFLVVVHTSILSQELVYEVITISPEVKYQTIEGFGGSLAFYESWLTAHPKKPEIYEALFGELSLDILRLRNAYDYDPGMIDRAKEFVDAAENSLGKPIDVLVTSWGPPAYLKSNNDRTHGGTLKYVVNGNIVTFDYRGFAHWWNLSLDEYNSHGIFPTYISIQNEPDFNATWESCLLQPEELIGASDTIAGYNIALDAVYDSISLRNKVPKILGPESVGIGYNSVENYINALDLSKLYGIGHHLYHGADANNPFASGDFSKVGAFHPEVPHFQTEFSGGNWWSVVGLIYKALHDENAVAYLYWDLAWTGAGLIDMDNPWNQSSWRDPQKGYSKTKEFYGFKQYSAFIHPGWERIEAEIPFEEGKVLAFKSPFSDSASIVIINTSENRSLKTALSVPGFSISDAAVYITSENMNCAMTGDASNSIIEIAPLSIATIPMMLATSTGNLIDSIVLSPTNPIIDSIKDSIQIYAQVQPVDAENKTIFWQIISGQDIATLSQSGLLTARGTTNGTVKIRASAIDGSGVFAEADVVLSNQIYVDHIELKASAGKIDVPGGSIQFTASALPENAFNKVLYWELSNGNEIATITQSGLLRATGTGDGEVTLRVSTTDGSGVFAEISIQITNQVAVSSINILTDSTIIDSYKGSLQLSAEVLPENASNKVLFWQIEQADSIGIIDQNGLVTATGNANGIVNVIAYSTDDSNISDQVEIEIRNQLTNLFTFTKEYIRFWSLNKNIFYAVPEDDSTYDIQLFSEDGKLVYLGKIPPRTSRGSISLPACPGGIYIIKISTSTRKYSSLIQLF